MLEAGQWDIYVSGPDGENISQVTDTPDLEVNPEWSPDGTRLAFGHFWSGADSQERAGLFVSNGAK